jgi:3-isopropylmalate/(R)-2-methylmalate dehydratase small subunit
MQAFARLTSRICPLDMADVDTDQILPKQFLKRIERAGFGPFAFFEWRYDEDGRPRPEFPMNREEHQGARILLAGRNFGCGSSREHAPWALQDTGFDVIIAPSFADIFRANCANIGVLTVDLDESEVRSLFGRVARDPSWQLMVDLDQQTLTGDSFTTTFEVDPHLRHRLLEGLDAIDLSLLHDDDISEFERNRPSWRPTVSV